MFILLLFQELNKDELTQHHTPSLKLGCSVVTVRQKFVTEIGKGCSLPFFTENRSEQAWTPGGTRGARDCGFLRLHGWSQMLLQRAVFTWGFAFVVTPAY